MSDTKELPIPKEHLQDLVDCLDDIPQLMNKIDGSLYDSPKRFKVIAPNQSYGFNAAMRGNRKVDVSDPSTSEHVHLMARQALKVLDQLAKLPAAKKVKRKSMNTISTMAREKLQSLKDNGVDIRKLYSSYDINRNGKVSYDEFKDSMILVDAGLAKDEVQELAMSLDKNKVGSIEYNNILDSLLEIETSSSASPKVSDLDSDALKRYPRNPVTAADSNRCNNEDFNAKVLDLPNGIAAEASWSEGSYLAQHEEATTRVIDLDPHYKGTKQSSSQDYSEKFNNSIPVALQRDPDFPLSGRRLYKQNVATVLNSLSSKGPPFYVDPSPELAKQYRKLKANIESKSVGNNNKQERPRSQSAPIKSRKKSFNGIDNNFILEKEMSLRSNLERTATDDGSNLQKQIAQEQKQASEITKQLENNPFYKGHVSTKAKVDKQIKEKRSKRLENMIANQLNGSINRFRHILRQQDPSNSGHVNLNEFKRALSKAGIKIEPPEVSEIFGAVARQMSTVKDATYSLGGKAIEIDSFVDRMQHRTVAPAFIHLQKPAATESVREGGSGRIFGPENKFGDFAKRAQEIRIMKKVLSSSRKLSNPMKLYHDMDSANNGWLTPDQLKNALHHMGANLTASEFNVILQKLDTNADGRIQAVEFEGLLQNNVAAFDAENANTLRKQISECPHYSSTFKSSDVFSIAMQKNNGSNDKNEICHSEFAPLDEKSNKRIAKLQQWNRLRHTFQSNPRAVLGAFTSGIDDIRNVPGDDRKHRSFSNPRPNATAIDGEKVQPLTFKQLKRNLSFMGVSIAPDDAHRLENLIQMKKEKFKENSLGRAIGISKSSDESVTLEDFCSAVGISVGRTAENKISIINPMEQDSDGGIFRSSLRSQSANPTVSTTAFLPNTKPHPTELRRRKFPEASYSMHSAYEPSKYWDHPKSIDNVMLFPSPLPNLREPWPHQAGSKYVAGAVDDMELRKGILKLRKSEAPKTVSKDRMNNDEDVGADTSLNESLAETDCSNYSGLRSQLSSRDVGRSRRSHSAPPTNRLNSSNRTYSKPTLAFNASKAMEEVLQHYQTPSTSNNSLNNGNDDKIRASAEAPKQQERALSGDSYGTVKIRKRWEPPTQEKLSRWGSTSLSDYYSSNKSSTALGAPSPGAIDAINGPLSSTNNANAIVADRQYNHEEKRKTDMRNYNPLTSTNWPSAQSPRSSVRQEQKYQTPTSPNVVSLRRQFQYHSASAPFARDD